MSSARPVRAERRVNLVSKLYKEQSMSGLIVIGSLNKQNMNFSELENIQNKEKQHFKKMTEHFFEILSSRRNEQWMSNIIPMIHEDSSPFARKRRADTLASAFVQDEICAPFLCLYSGTNSAGTV